MTQDSFHFYYPQWNEHDRPTVRCPHLKDRRIGDAYCQHNCPNLLEVIDEKYRTIIKCAGKGMAVYEAHNNIVKAIHAVTESAKEEGR